MLAGILIATAWFSVFLVAHVVWLHVFPPTNRFNAILTAFLVSAGGAVATFVCLLLVAEGRGSTSLPQTTVHLCIILATMGALFVLYMPLYFVIASSLTMQTLDLLNRSANGDLSIDRLRAVFASRNLVAGRMKTMTANGYLVEAGDKYRLTTKGVLVAYVFQSLKRLWRLGSGG